MAKRKQISPSNSKGKQIAPSKSTGGSGGRFETHVQSSFVALMLTGGFAPCLPAAPITKIMLQAKWDGFATDDLIVFTTHPKSNQTRKLLCQVKETISIGNNSLFKSVIKEAWIDFNNSKKFTHKMDAIALITGPMTYTDINDVRTILEWSRSGSDAKSFLEKVELAKFSSDSKRKKLKVFKDSLTFAKGSPITDEELFEFLQHFHFIGYDLDIKTGVTLSLLHSLIGVYSPEDTESLWAQIVYEVDYLNPNAGEITLESIPDHIRAAFKERATKTIPQELVVTSHKVEPSWSDFKHPKTLAGINLIGGWSDTNSNDQDAITTFLNEKLSVWNEEARDILLEQNSPIKLTNGRWQINDRNKLWSEIGPRVFDDSISRFRELAKMVLMEIDPRFEIAPENRMAARMSGKKLKYSHELRQGITETLALLAVADGALKNLSLHEARNTPIIVVRDVFENADWKQWASLGKLIITLAEAAPEEFLKAVENALQQDPCPFDELFIQEKDNLFGGNYMSSILWALETLAWDEKYLIRVCVILAWLDARDPGGKTSNSPINSLSTILLPWYPQTLASAEKQKLAFESIQEDLPDVAWKLAKKLLPNNTQVSTGSVKPVWRNVLPEDWTPSVTESEFRLQAMYYSHAAVGLAKNDIRRLNSLAKNINNFSPESLLKMVDEVSIDVITEKDESELTQLWKTFTALQASIQKNKDLDSNVKKHATSKLTNIISAIAPKSPLNLNAQFFSDGYFSRAYKGETFEKREERLGNLRIKAVKSIVTYGGIDTVIKFAESVDQPYEVGRALASFATSKTDKHLLPKNLIVTDKNLLYFISTYIKCRFKDNGMKWVDSLGVSKWNLEQKAQLLSHLFFTLDTWKKVEELLGPDEGLYWSNVNVNGFEEKENLEYALDKLTEYGRPAAALKCIYQSKHSSPDIDIIRTIKILKATAFSNESRDHSVASPYEITAIIKKLHESDLTNLSEEHKKNMLEIEWLYLPILNKHSEAQPKLLGLKLGLDPEFFAEMIRFIYKSEKHTDEERVITPADRITAKNAYKLLSEWKTIPGTQPDGSFSEPSFKRWMTEVRKICTESGHWKVASQKIGQVLFYSPADLDGLWINRVIAKELDLMANSGLRDGFNTGAFNSRGVHTVDPTGKQEEAIGDRYMTKANEIEMARLSRFAASLKKLANSYYRDAERTRLEHASEQNEQD